MERPHELRRVRIGAVVVGIGLGGFIDGILLHQILQWHNMLSSVLPPTTLEAMQTNMLWDGLFHASVWLATLVGIVLIWTGAQRSTALPSATWLVGLMLIGWGIFNVTEGAVNHHLLGIHHVRGWSPNPIWDYGFLLSGVLLVGVGGLLTRWGNGRRVRIAGH